MLVRVLTILGWLWLSGFLGYLVGSLPTAYLIVRWIKNVDIRKAGSKSVGVFNSFKVSGSYLIAFCVLVFDVIKGASAIFLVSEVIGVGFVYLAAAGIGAVLGHNFPIWLKFQGGRGLAPAAGVALVLSPQLIVFWTVFWSAGYIMTRRINLANVIASMLTLIAILVAPPSFIRQIMPNDAVVLHFKFFFVLLFGMILIKHIEPVSEFFLELRNAKQSPEEIPDGRS